MKWSNLKASLRCPYCESKLTCKFIKSDPRYENWGVCRCSCDEYPIVEGIFYLIKDDRRSNRHAVSHIKSRKYLSAVWMLLYTSHRNYKLIALSAYFFRRWLQLSLSLKFWLRILKQTGPSKDWITYILERNNRDDIHVALNLTIRYAKRGGILLDIGYGLGNLHTLLQKNKFSSFFVGLDKSFCFLFLSAIHREKTDVLLVCTDVEAGLPFLDSTFTDVVIVDTFCSTFKKEYVISETARVLRDHRFLYFVNLYGTSRRSYYWGYGIKYDNLRKMLERYFQKIRFVESCLINGKVRKIKEISKTKLSYSGYAIK